MTRCLHDIPISSLNIIFVFIQVLVANRVHLPLDWKEERNSIYNVAILRFPKEIDVLLPLLETRESNDTMVSMYPNTKIHALGLGPVPEIARFEVVKDRLCPHVLNLGHGMFCAYSRWERHYRLLGNVVYDNDNE